MRLRLLRGFLAYPRSYRDVWIATGTQTAATCSKHEGSAG